MFHIEKKQLSSGPIITRIMLIGQIKKVLGICKFSCRASNFVDIRNQQKMESEITTKFCDLISIIVVIIHKKLQLHWMFKTKFRSVGHFSTPSSHWAWTRVQTTLALTGLIKSEYFSSIGSLACHFINLLMIGKWLIKLSNAFVLPGQERLIINILYRWSGMCCQFGLCSLISSLAILSMLIFFIYFFLLYLICFIIFSFISYNLKKNTRSFLIL